MRWQRIGASLFIVGSLLAVGTGCSSIDKNASSAQTVEAKNWVKQQMKTKQNSISEWEKEASRPKSAPADQAIAQLAVNILSKNVASLIEENGNNKPALLASVMKKEQQPKSTDLPSLASLVLKEKSQLDGGKTMYRLEGSVFTSVPDKLYPVTITVRVNNQGEIEYFEIDK
ncbi:hypothetical protein [Aneurinibacillus aneurinilyticus]|jgi:hypothetical protein|uniref:Lipoprotein n=2 Tax=Aneurinibacillus aneurinilyticus TaxID=1391 RepID=A0A848CPE4_ANEAE|nr:hypothetical protein [Aneurinibacillus aneurinilyticus]ERI08236.1 hypothetical protein HMPREF0083_03717 [Aneurinibacillus aneurinilyticus ATCC 12856]MED0670471.1 hypothetical protein [Aneurinibacillus aneurinilyticus]MED0704603.1 hypothetical protein [Aneurinibacillus aneurinilyticus]MED0721535.1 hypothetical protein [Aneurinibacillus aneurinilyticus]MED0734803.1 hypothetical protein [Aneurinibacillus aneurinilyticus]